MARWPGMIDAGQDPDDFLHVTDLYTTPTRLAGATDKIPSDRVTDGIDQSALCLLGEDDLHRNYMLHYSGIVTSLSVADTSVFLCDNLRTNGR